MANPAFVEISLSGPLLFLKYENHRMNGHKSERES